MFKTPPSIGAYMRLFALYLYCGLFLSFPLQANNPQTSFGSLKITDLTGQPVQFFCHNPDIFSINAQLSVVTPAAGSSWLWSAKPAGFVQFTNATATFTGARFFNNTSSPQVVTLYLRGINANGLVETDSTQVTVDGALSINLEVTDQSGTPDDGSICFGDTATLSATATGGNGIYNYAWTNGISSTASSVQYVPPYNGVLGQVFATVKDGFGCTAAGAESIRGISELKLTVDQNLNCGGQNNLVIRISGGEPQFGSYQFFINQGQGQFQTMFPWNYPIMSSGSVTSNYTVQAVDSRGCETTETEVVTWLVDADGDGFCSNVDCNDNNPAIHPNQAEICGNGIDDNCNGQIDEGCVVADFGQISIRNAAGNAISSLCYDGNANQNVLLSISNAQSGVNWQWQATPSSFFNILNPTSASTPVTAKNTGNTQQVQLILKGVKNGTTQYDTAYLILNSQVLLKAEAIENSGQSNDGVVCAGESMQLRATSAGGTPPYSFEWPAQQSFQQNFTFNPLYDNFSRSITVNTRDALGCLATASVNTQGKAAITVQVQQQLSCKGQNRLLLSANGNYTLRINNGAPQTISTTPSLYDITLTNAPSQNFALLLTDSYGCSASKIETVTALLDADNDGFCSADDCNDNNPAIHPNQPEICGNGIDDNCNGQIDEGCTASDFGQISLENRFGNAISTLCYDENADSNVVLRVLNAENGINWQWKATPDSIFSILAANSVQSFVRAKNTGNTQLIEIVLKGTKNGITQYDTARLLIYSKFTAQALAVENSGKSNDGVVCFGDSLRLEVKTMGGKTPYTYSWLSPNQMNMQSLTFAPLYDNISRFMPLTVRDSNGCMASSKVAVQGTSKLQVIIQAQISCTSQNSLLLFVSGGLPTKTGRYSVSINNQAAQLHQNFPWDYPITPTNAASELFSVMATDSVACQTSASQSVMWLRDLDGDGVCSNDDCDDLSSAVSPFHAEICGNGIDDNCDGQIDEHCNTPPTSVYCNTGGVSDAYGWIQKVKFENTLHYSGNENGYADFTETEVVVSNAVTGFSVQLWPSSFGGNYYPLYWSIWVDLNYDGDFLDANELVFQTYGQGKKFGTIRIPSAENGLGATRMRVTASYGNTYAAACGTYAAGETQDYTLVQRALPPCLVSQLSGLDFTAYAKGPKETELRWVNNTGPLNDYFAIERSTNGLDFTEISRKDGEGDKDAMLYFSDKDKTPAEGLNYYRVRWVLLDGTVQYSKVQTVYFDRMPTVMLYPNPTRGEVSVLVEHLSSEPVTIRLISSLGKIISSKIVQFDAANPIEKIELEGIPSGIYEVQIVSEKHRAICKKLVIEQG